MGVNLSKQEYNSVYTQCTNIMNNFLNKQTTNVNLNQNSFQKIKINADNVKCAGDFGTIQTMNNSANAILQLSSKNNSVISNDLITQLTNDIKSTLSQTNSGLLNMFQANVNVNTTNVDQTIRTTIGTSIQNVLDQTFSVNTQGGQVLELDLSKLISGGDCIFKQDMVIKQFTTLVLDNIANSLVQNSEEVKSDNKSDTKVDQFNQGVSLGGLLGFGKLGFGGDILVVVIVLAIIGGVGYAIVNRKKKK